MIEYTSKHTPMMKQYLEIKQNYPEMLVFYRMGDFYELFFEDAITASKLLGITLTTRGSSNGSAIKMAGVPFHALEQYLLKLVKLDNSIVIVDQVGEVNGKGPVERKVTRIITPGTLTEASLLNDREDNLICCIYIHKEECGIATMSVSTGTFWVSNFKENDIFNELERIGSNELLIQESQRNKFNQLKLRYTIKSIPEWNFDFTTSYRKLCTHFKVNDLSGFGIEQSNKLVVIVASVLLEYVKQTQCNNLPHIQKITLETNQQQLQLDAISRRNLEINYTIRGETTPTLLSVMDNCTTVMGSRKLRVWLNNPLINQDEVKMRQDVVKSLLSEYTKVTEILSGVVDIERISSRIALGSARPRDLSALRDSLTILPQLYYLKSLGDSLINTLLSVIDGVSEEISNYLTKAIKLEPNNFVRDGGVINDGFSDKLDHLRDIQTNANKYLEQITQEEQAKTKIPNLRVEYNKVHGFYIEISNSYLDKVPSNYRRTQTLKHVERFITPELKQFEAEFLTALDNSLTLEKEIYTEVLGHLNQYINQLQQLAGAIATLDILNNFAQIAKNNNYICPELVVGNIITIKSGRHPVIEKEVEQFIANDINLSDKTKFLLITGPNMGGKSTYMRQIAITVLLSYCGSFVPAQEAIIGSVDRIFTRIGASDDLSSGKSTFMVEMTETANILNNATSNSLILLDEVGRGTSTYDGLSLAHAISRFLIEKINAYTLFATHYFELTNFINKYPTAKNVHLSAVEHDDTIVFLHHVYEGALDKSYGIQVAQLAGIPKPVINMAKKYLQNIEASQNNNQLDLFNEVVIEKIVYMEKPEDALQNNAIAMQNKKSPSMTNEYQHIIDAFRDVNPDNLTAKGALDFIYSLKSKL